VYVGGSFIEANGIARSRLAALETSTGNLIPGWDPAPDGAVYAIEPAGDRIYVGGEFQSVGGGSAGLIAALDADSGNAVAWDPAGSSTPAVRVNSISVAGRDVYAGGDFGSIGGGNNYLESFDASTAAASGPFSPFVNNVVFAVEADDEFVIAGGTFTIAGSGSRSRVAALRPDGGLCPWNPSLNASVLDIVRVGDSVYVGGGFDSASASARPYFARYDIDRTPPITTMVLDPAKPNGDHDWYRTKPQMSFSTNDSGSTTEWWIPAGTPSSVSPYDLDSGVWEILYASTDAYLNREATRGPEIVRVDLDAPTATNLPPGIASGTATVTITGYDGTTYLEGGSVSGIDRIAWRASTAGEAAWSDWRTETGATATVSVYGKGIDRSVQYYSVDVAGNRSDTGSVTFTIPNRAPVAVEDRYSAVSGQALFVPAPGIFANDTDPDGDPIVRGRVVTFPAHGTLWADMLTGANSYTPNFGFVGEDSFGYEVSDGEATSTLGAVRFTVAPSLPPGHALTTPKTSTSRPRARRTFTLSGRIYPKHPTRPSAVLVQGDYFDGSQWVSGYGGVARMSRARSYTKYSRSLKLRVKGLWRFRAAHGQAGYATLYSDYRYVTVR
jgi:hypothetical protein